MHADKIQIVSLKIMLAFVRVNQAQPVIQYLVVYQSPIVASIRNVKLAQFVKQVFAAPYAPQIANASLINYVCKAFANQHATIIPHAQTSNFVKIIFVRRRFAAAAMMIVCLTSTASSTHMVVRNVKMRVKDVICVAEIRNVQCVVIMLNVRVKLVLLRIVKVVVDPLNANRTTTVHRTNTVKRISVNWRAKEDLHVVKRRSVPLKIIDRPVIVNRAIVAIHEFSVMPLIFAEMHHVDRVLFVQILKDHSTVLVLPAMLAILIMKDVA